MPSDYKLIAVDLDGTLLDRSGKPHPADLAALIALREAGFVVSILTGRLYAGTRLTAAALGLVGPVGCADGSHLVDHVSGRTLMHHPIDAVRSQFFRNAFLEHEATVFGFNDDTIVFDAAGESYMPFMKTWSEDVRVVDCVLDHEFFTRGGGTAVVAIAEEAAIQSVCNHVNAACTQAGVPLMQIASFPLNRVNTNLHALLARAETATKGTALAWLAQHHGVALEETVVVGDWWNDVSMFDVAGCSFAMGQAPDEVKARAKRVLEETSEHGGGIARIARELFGVTA